MKQPIRILTSAEILRSQRAWRNTVLLLAIGCTLWAFFTRSGWPLLPATLFAVAGLVATQLIKDCELYP